jgi:hypothetical protein
MISYVTSSFNTIKPTSIPGIKDQEKYQRNGKFWHNDKC